MVMVPLIPMTVMAIIVMIMMMVMTVRVPTATAPWPVALGGLRRAGIGHSFGMFR